MRASRLLAFGLALPIVVCAIPAALGAEQLSGAQATTPAPRGAGAQARNSRDTAARAQGFSVVLVLGDLRATPGEEDVPPAARKALTDMKDFLPYRSYRLLDAAWILCCNNNRAATRLRGPDDHDYELEIESGPIDQARMSVRFLLRDLTSGEPSKPVPGKSQGIAELEKRVEVLKAQLEDARKSQGPRHPDVVRLEAEVKAAVQRLAQAKEGGERQPEFERKPKETLAQSKFGDRSIMNSSFTMDVGETVVVGTSRLSGNSKALIALLTAVPPRSTR
jgi:hypothetical protein